MLDHFLPKVHDMPVVVLAAYRGAEIWAAECGFLVVLRCVRLCWHFCGGESLVAVLPDKAILRHSVCW